jgi:predicted anti-sigma-YlaC factor YlaD
MLEAARSIPRRCRRLLHAADTLLSGRRLSASLYAHAASCPRCRAYLMKVGRVSLGLSLLRGQQQPRNLLGNANRVALQKLRRAIRYCPEADRLRRARARVSPLVRLMEASQWALSGAVCLAVVCLLRIDVSNGVRKTAEMGEKLAAHHEIEHIYGRDSDWA